jgi:hypothetical protein
MDMDVVDIIEVIRAVTTSRTTIIMETRTSDKEVHHHHHHLLNITLHHRRRLIKVIHTWVDLQIRIIIMAPRRRHGAHRLLRIYRLDLRLTRRLRRHMFILLLRLLLRVHRRRRQVRVNMHRRLCRCQCHILGSRWIVLGFICWDSWSII